jgi:hypothetical protein
MKTTLPNAAHLPAVLTIIILVLRAAPIPRELK